MKNSNLEDQLKDAFGNFEPEVDPSVWTNISSQLPATPGSVQPVTNPSGIFSSISSTGAWIAAAAAILITGTSVYFALQHQPAVAPVIVTPETESNTTVTEPVTASDYGKSQNPQSQTGETDSQSATPKHSGQERSTIHSSGSSALNVPVKPANSITEADPAQHSTTQMAPVSAPKPDISSANNPVQKTESTENQTVVPLKLIVNANGGFAPLAITALSNQPGLKATFDFGDGNTSTGESATHTYKDPGTYSLQCISGDQKADQTIEVLDAIPTAFSPNGDGANDLFVIDNPSISTMEIRIFNRNGRLIYSGKGSPISWNGQYADGRPAETGTYFYDIFATSTSGNVYKQKGTLTLFR